MQLRLGRIRWVFEHPTFRESPVRMSWRVMSWAAHCLLRRPPVVRFRDPEFLLALPPVWSGGGGSSPYLWRERREPEQAVFAKLLEPGMVVLEGGPSTGSYTFTAAARVGPTGRVVALEPGDEARSWLERSKALNRFHHLVIRPEALWDRTGTAEIHRLHGRDVAWSLTAPEGYFTETASLETITIAGALTREGLDRVDALKLEIEGAEEATLRAATDLLAEWRPFVLFTVNPSLLRRAGLDQGGAMKVLRESGYRIFRMEGGKMEEILDPPTGYRHLLAYPSEKGMPRI